MTYHYIPLLERHRCEAMGRGDQKGRKSGSRTELHGEYTTLVLQGRAEANEYGVFFLEDLSYREVGVKHSTHHSPRADRHRTFNLEQIDGFAQSLERIF
jgi:hypothetical protein